MASACTRLMRPFRYARKVNSPGFASRAPAAIVARTMASRMTGLPCAEISTTSSPVYERGAGNTVTMASSITPPCSSTIRASVACRASNGRPARREAIGVAEGPLILTTPSPPRPGGVAIATMVSSVENMGPARPEDPVYLENAGAAGSEDPACICRADLQVRQSSSRSPLRADNDRLQKRIPNALRRHFGIFGDGQVYEAPCVRIERPHFLRSA